MTFLDNAFSLQKSVDLHLHQPVRNRQFLLAGFVWCCLMVAAPVAGAADDVPQLMLESSIYPTFLGLAVQAEKSGPAGYSSANNANVGYGEGLNWPAPEVFNITLKLTDRVGVLLSDTPTVAAQAADIRAKAAQVMAAMATPGVDTQADEMQTMAAQVAVAQAIAKQAIALAIQALDTQAAPVVQGACISSETETAPAPESFLLASAYSPASTLPELPQTATHTNLPPPIERFTFFPSVRGLSLSMGVDYSSGKYGGPSQVDTVVMPLTVKYEASKWAFKLTISRIEVIESQTLVDWWGDSISYRAVNSGLGDIGAAVTYYAYDNQDFTAGLDLTGKIKFGTASREKGLGNGQNDYAGQVNGYWSIGNLTATGSVGYKVPGQPPGAKLRNVFNGSIGAGYKYSQAVRLGVSMDQRQKSSERGAPQREVSAYLSYGFSKNWNIQGYILKGFADGSPDIGAGATLMVSLN